jgi:AsmA protein
MSRNGGRMSGFLKVAAIIVVLLVVIVLVLPFVLDANQFRPALESQLTAALGRQVKVGNLKLSILSGGVAVDDIAIADDPAFSRSPFVTAKSLSIGIELWPLIFSRQVHITGISLDRPAITLIRSASGKWNFSSLGGKADSKDSSANHGDFSGTDVSIRQLKITGGRITFMEGRKKPSTYDNVNIVVRDFSPASAFPFTLSASMPGGGALKLEGSAGPLNTTDTVATPLKADLNVTHFDLVASGFVEPSAGLAGLFDFGGALTSDGKQARSNGHATANKLLLIKGGSPAGRPVALDYSLNYDTANQKGVLNDAKVQYGNAVAHLNGSYEVQGDSLVLKMRLRGTNMPVQDLTGLLPAFGVTLPRGASLQGGTLNTDLTAEGPIEKLVTTGTAEISTTRLVGFDLAGKMAAVAALAGIQSSQETEIQEFATGMRMAPDGIQVSNLKLIMPALGELSGAGRISADQSLDFTMRATLKPGGVLGGGLAQLVKGGALTVPFFVRGTASDPKFVPDVKNAAGGILNSVLSGQGAKEGQGNTGNAIGNALRDLFKKKK